MEQKNHVTRPLLIVAGEASADRHAADVLRAIQSRHLETRAFGMGGSSLRQAGFETVAHAESFAVAGLTEIVRHVPRAWRLMHQLLRLCALRQVKVALLIDMPEFNLPLAARLKAMGIRVIYYISPQVWAWRPGRVETIRRVVDEMLVILPFEENFYRKKGVKARFVGHPLVEQTAQEGADTAAESARKDLQLPCGSGPVVALLPGSRRLEVERLLPTMVAGLSVLGRLYPHLQAVLPVANTIDRKRVEQLIARCSVPIKVVNEQSHLAVCACDVAVVASGTATLQTALIGRPMVVVYRVSRLTYTMLRRLVRVPYISLVNLIADEPVVPELIQDQFTPAAMACCVMAQLDDDKARAYTLGRLAWVRAELGRFSAAPQVAEAVTLSWDNLPVDQATVCSYVR